MSFPKSRVAKNTPIDSVNSRNLTGFCIVSAIFISGLVTNIVVAAKIVAIGPFFLPASVFIWALTYPCSDIIAETYGRPYANKMVLGGFISYSLALLTIGAAIMMPAAPFWDKQSAFETVLSSSIRVMFAALISYLITQFFDVYIFHRIKQHTGDKRLWLRNNLSTLCSQTMGNIIFLGLAFLGTMPLENWLQLFTNNLMFRYALAFSDTAIVYLGVYAIYRIYPELRRKE